VRRGVRARVEVLGVEVDPLTEEELESEVARLARSDGISLVLNANARCLNLCYVDPELRSFFDGAEVVFCDGAGVVLAAKMLGRRLPARITYADWLSSLCALAVREGLSLFFLGSRPGVADEAARRLRERFPGLKVAGTHHGHFDHRLGSAENEAVLHRIESAAPDLLLVGFGMPLQERWLMENRRRLNVRVALTCGAAFDYASGRLRRGPRLLTQSGFEWLARLLVEPRRLWRRYLLGNPLFLYRVLRQRLREGARGR
jgi:N-acetylglucosaminyldiphosphoundecaprenol N-acetyl-beta-D-mannosaminyltransferase